jgi:hypothetical protein
MDASFFLPFRHQNLILISLSVAQFTAAALKRGVGEVHDLMCVIFVDSL